MKLNTKSSITLPPEELKLVSYLMKKLKIKTKVEVVRSGLRLLKERTEREALRSSYLAASNAVRSELESEVSNDNDMIDPIND